METGALRDAIHTQTESEGTYVIAGDSKVFYGHIIEHGSVNAPPHPYLVPAAEERKDDVAYLVAAVVKKIT